MRGVCIILEAEVARNYLELRTSQQRLRIARDNLQIQEQTVALVRNKLEIGIGGELEVAQAEAQAALTKSEIPTLESTTSQAIHQLALLLGQQPHFLKAELTTVSDIPPVPPQLPTILPSELLRQRPDIRAAERQLAAATATVGAAIAELYPRFSLLALLGLQSTSLGDLVAASSHFWAAGPTMRWSLFDGGRARASIAISEARLDHAQATYEKTVLTALAETENSLVAYAREQEKHAILGQAVASGQQALTLANGQYEAGLTTFLNVLLSQAALFQSQDKLTLSDQRLALNMVALYKALGGGWQTEDLGPVTSLPGIGPKNRHIARNNP
jgi:NodT family efflux transporter outer membrane factor (OMF) lipoprotein